MGHDATGRQRSAHHEAEPPDGRAGPTGEGSVGVNVGDLAPDVDLVDHTGAPWRISDHRGRPVVLILHRHLA